MKKIFSVAIMMAAFPFLGLMNGFATEPAEKNIESICQEMAVESGIADDELAEFMESCKAELLQEAKDNEASEQEEDTVDSESTDESYDDSEEQEAEEL